MGVDVTASVMVFVTVAVGVTVLEAVKAGVIVSVSVGVGVKVSVKVGVGVNTFVTVAVGVNVLVKVGVAVTVFVNVTVGVIICVVVGVVVVVSVGVRRSGVVAGGLATMISRNGGNSPSFEEYLAASVVVEDTRREYSPSSVISEVKSMETQLLIATVSSEATRVESAIGALFQFIVSSAQKLSSTR